MTDEDLRHIPPDPPTFQCAEIGEGLVVGAPLTSTGFRVLIHGVGGIGKTSLACMAPGPVFLFDLDESASDLVKRFAANGITAPQVVRDITDFDSLIAAVESPGWQNVSDGTIVIDSWSVVEEWEEAWVIVNIPHENGANYKTIKSIEDYGFGKGYGHMHDASMRLLNALTEHVHAGRNVVIVAHCCTSSFPNPVGPDFIRYEPRVMTVSPTSRARYDTRKRLIEWAAHVLFVNYDIDVKVKSGDKHGKATSTGSRTIYPVETATALAKSRSLSDEIVYREGDAELWRQLLA